MFESVTIKEEYVDSSTIKVESHWQTEQNCDGDNYTHTINKEISFKQEPKNEELDLKSKQVLDCSGLKTNNNALLKTHLNEHANTFQCYQCDYQATRKALLRKHVVRHKLNQFSTKTYTCRVCKWKTNCKYSIKEHRLVHVSVNNFACNQCEYKTYSRESLRKHVNKHTGKYTCDQCDYIAGEIHRLKMHILTHLVAKTYRCDECDFETDCKYRFVKHQTIHTLAEIYKCYHCTFYSKSKNSLKKHMHKHIVRFKCYQCRYTAITKYTLEQHILKHRHQKRAVVEKPKVLTCDYCDWKTICEDSLKNHHLVHVDLNNYMERRRYFCF